MHELINQTLRYVVFLSLLVMHVHKLQVVTDALVNPPRPDDPSYNLYQKEMTAIISSLRNKARLVYQRMNRIPGVQCNEIQGSMEAFPRLDIPHEAWDDARVRCTYLYAVALLAPKLF